MTDIQFEGESEFERPSATAAPSPLFVRLLLRTGLVQTERGANYVLIGIIVACILIVLYTMYFQNGSSQAPPVPINSVQTN